MIREIFWNEIDQIWETKEEMEKNKKENVASPEMRIFFEKLLELKALVKMYADRTHMASFQEVYQKLDEIIKEAK